MVTERPQWGHTSALVEIAPPQWGHVGSGIACPPFASSGDDHTSAGYAEAFDKHKGVCDGIPIIEPAPVVTKQAAVFRDLFDHPSQFRHFQPYLTGLIVLPNKNLANMARCILDSPDKTRDFRVLAEAPWQDADGWAIKLPGPGIVLEELVPLIPDNAYRPGQVRDHTHWSLA